MIEHALLTAIRAHRGQKYGDGRSYLLHILEVAGRLRHEDDDIVTVAILHDAIEDGGLTYEEAHATFGSRVAAAIDAITHRKWPPYDEKYAEYIERLAKNPDAVTVKLEDLGVNLDNNPPESLRERYDAAWQYLSNIKYPEDDQVNSLNELRDFDHEGTP